jgi:predicted dehydrogenase
MSNRKRFAQVGLGGRSRMFTDAVVQTYSDTCRMVGLCDINPGRLQLAVERAREKGTEVPGFAADQFDRMIDRTKCDCVIVTTKDCHHDEYICRAMELGCDVITEKPMTTDEQKCRRIVQTQKKTGKKCTVTFNYRYAPPRTQVKDLLMSGLIGEVLSVDFHWLLDTHHGADYFRRWHRNKADSGGLIVHKATHHFDLVNWWLSDIPETVFAIGHRRFYTPRTADRYGLTKRGERCHGCAEAERCPFRLDLAGNENLKKLYLDNEQYDGYYRDRCVFSGQIDIEDSMNVVVAYAGGVKLSYSLNAFMPWEGYTVAFNGSKGRIEHTCQEKVYINADGSVPGALKKEGTAVKIFPHRQAAYQAEVWTGAGGHGGGDSPLLEDVFGTDPPDDKYKRAADHRSGAYSILTGVAANNSMATGQPVRIADLVANIHRPDYPPMPSPDEPLPMIPDATS